MNHAIIFDNIPFRVFEQHNRVGNPANRPVFVINPVFNGLLRFRDENVGEKPRHPFPVVRMDNLKPQIRPPVEFFGRVAENRLACRAMRGFVGFPVLKRDVVNIIGDGIRDMPVAFFAFAQRLLDELAPGDFVFQLLIRVRQFGGAFLHADFQLIMRLLQR